MDEKIHYYRLPPSWRETLIRYVISENEKHYGILKQGWIFEDEVAALCSEEQQYTHSHVFAALAGDKICGSIRICRKMPRQVFEYEKDEARLGSADGSLNEIADAYRQVSCKGTSDRFFLPSVLHRVRTAEFSIILGIVNESPDRQALSVVVHTTVYPPPAASVGNNRYIYLLKLWREFDPEKHGTLKAYVGR